MYTNSLRCSWQYNLLDLPFYTLPMVITSSWLAPRSLKPQPTKYQIRDTNLFSVTILTDFQTIPYPKPSNPSNRKLPVCQRQLHYDNSTRLSRTQTANPVSSQAHQILDLTFHQHDLLFRTHKAELLALARTGKR